MPHKMHWILLISEDLQVSGETGIDLESFFAKSEIKGKSAVHLRPEGYLEKPVDPEKLITLIEEFFN